MGFSAAPPRLDPATMVQTIDTWDDRADAALLLLDVPWHGLLADSSAADLVNRDALPLVRIYRQRGFPIVAMVEPADGLARDREAPALIAAGRSITETAVQARYQAYVLALDSIVHPEFLGLAAETNLIRASAPRAMYSALGTMTRNTAAALHARGTTARLFVSVQVETAWGRLAGTGKFVGINTDLHDFPFIDVLGLSSYPFLGGFTDPASVPDDYYERLQARAGLPAIVVEGGWSSTSVAMVSSTPELEARWIDRQMELASKQPLVAVFQITFTDLDLASYGSSASAPLATFAHLGLVDTKFRPKPALAAWDSTFLRPLHP